MWKPTQISPVSYPLDGNDSCFQVEDHSYWFVHRNDCIIKIISQFPPKGEFYDIGGGNGFVSHELQKANVESVLVEPGSGVLNAARRGVRRIIHSALEDTGFHEETLPAAGAFDVIEHIGQVDDFLTNIYALLKKDGRFYWSIRDFCG